MSKNNGFTQGLPKKSGYYLFQRKPGCTVGEVMVKVLLPGDNRRELVRFMDSWRRGKDTPAPDAQSKAERNYAEFRLDDPFIENGWYKPVEQPNPAAAAIAYALELDDDDDAVQFLRMWNEGSFDDIRREYDALPEELFIGAESGYEPVTLIQDGGGA